MDQAKGYIIALAVFCVGTGVALGMLVEKEYSKRSFPHSVFKQRMAEHQQSGRGGERQKGQMGKTRKEGGRQAGAQGIFERIGEKLDLTSEQETQLQAILEASKQQIQQVSEEFRGNLETIKESSSSKISEILNPEQKQQFEQMTAKMEQRRQKKQGFKREFAE
ncbi:hypothetical protein ACFL2I_02555 [Candidatus Omnitrophota bacterium]